MKKHSENYELCFSGCFFFGALINFLETSASDLAISLLDINEKDLPSPGLGEGRAKEAT